MDATSIRSLVDLRDRVLQKSRIAFGNRLSAIERGSDPASDATKAMLEKWLERFQDLEKEATADIAALVDGVEIVEQMCAVKGIGKTLAARVISMIDIRTADSVSALWRYAGYAVIDGQRERPVKGEKLHYNARLKTACYLVASQFLKANSPYRRVYDSAREYYAANRPDWTKGHCHAASLRKMIKVWLAHLWERWRLLEGLPVRDLYVQEKLKHEHYYTPEEFGWPDLLDDYPVDLQEVEDEDYALLD